MRCTFLTNHARVLVCIAEDPQVRLREIAQRLGITERAAQSLVNDLVDAGYVTRRRVGRRNRYAIDASLPLRHPSEQRLAVGSSWQCSNATGIAARIRGKPKRTCGSAPMPTLTDRQSQLAGSCDGFAESLESRAGSVSGSPPRPKWHPAA
jgi:DNA-binding transcriptional ArsR family regulator